MNRRWRRYANVAEGVHARILEIGGEFDDRHLTLAEAGASEPEVLGAFSRARAAFAVAFALQDGSEALHEAIYEAGMSCSNAVGFVSEISEVSTAR